MNRDYIKEAYKYYKIGPKEYMILWKMYFKITGVTRYRVEYLATGKGFTTIEEYIEIAKEEPDSLRFRLDTLEISPEDFEDMIDAIEGIREGKDNKKTKMFNDLYNYLSSELGEYVPINIFKFIILTEGKTGEWGLDIGYNDVWNHDRYRYKYIDKNYVNKED